MKLELELSVPGHFARKMHEQCQHRISNSHHNRVRSLDRRAWKARLGQAPVGARSVSTLSHVFTQPKLFTEISAYALHAFLNTRGDESFSRFRPCPRQGPAWEGIPMLQSHTQQTRLGRWRQSASLSSAIARGRSSSKIDRPILQQPAKRSVSLRH